MKLPDGNSKGDKHRRLKEVEDLKERCLVSRVQRREEYTSRRLYWLYGSDGSYENEDVDTGQGPPPGNKMWPHIDHLSSMLYAHETTRFSIELGAKIHRDFQSQCDAMTDAVSEEWHTSNTDIVFGTGVTLALVYASMFIKPVWKKTGIYPGLILPHNFGVLREDTSQLSKQEAFVHCYTITPSQFRNDYGELPRFADIFKRISKRGSNLTDSEQTGLNKIIMGAQDPLSGGSPGFVDWLSQVSMNYIPHVQEELIDMYELFVYDDAIHDYRIFTIADPFVPIFDRPLKEAGGLANELPIRQIIPHPDPNYFWGVSEVERLTPLQTYRNKIMAQIDHLQEIEAHPPSTASGFPGDLLELQYAMDTPGGFANQPDPASVGGQPKAERVRVEVPQDLYARLDRNDRMFEEMSGLPPITQGRGEAGVRSQGQTSTLAKLGSSRAKKRALVVEDSIEDVATYYAKLLQEFDKDRLFDEEGKEFVAAQFPDSYTVKVDAHSSSPIFAEDVKELAERMLKAKAITRKRYLQMIGVPNYRQLVWELETKIEPGEAQAAKEQRDLEMMRIQNRAEGRPRKVNGGGQQPNA